MFHKIGFQHSGGSKKLPQGLVEMVFASPKVEGSWIRVRDGHKNSKNQGGKQN
jgi:hypothetical protein